MGRAQVYSARCAEGVTKLSGIETAEAADFVAALKKDYSALGVRIRTLTHDVSCEGTKVTLRLHYPAIRGRSATMGELVDAIVAYLTPFALPRSQLQELISKYGILPPDEFLVRHALLQQEAQSLFKRAQKATGRNGEGGELLLYLLTEWILGAPQMLAKMALKTDSEMAVHGSDGIHVGICPTTNKLKLYWGEAKLYGNIKDGVASAVASITEALTYESASFELKLIKRHIDMAGIPMAAKELVLKYLDPFDELYNERLDVTTCLIGFNFEVYGTLHSLEDHQVLSSFEDEARGVLIEMGPAVAKALCSAKLHQHEIELFFFPVPAVQEFRDLFQAKIGWNS